MSIIPKSKANSSAAEYSVQARALLEEGGCTHKTLGRTQGLLCSPHSHWTFGCSQSLPQPWAHLLLQRQLPQTGAGTGHTQMPLPSLHNSRIQSVIIQSFIIPPTSPGFILFSCTSFAFFVLFNSQGLHRSTMKSQGTMSHNQTDHNH